MLTTVTITDGRQIVLDDLDQITPAQGLDLATAVADLLVRSGQIRDDVALSGPHLLQFLSEMADWLSTRTDTSFVVNVTYDKQGPSETLGVFGSKDEAVIDIARRVVDRATAKGVVVTDAQRETLTASIDLMTGFCGEGYRSTGRADEAALAPIRAAIGWVDYDIADVDNVASEPSDRIVLKGKADTYSSKRGIRYVEMCVSDPYDHDVNFKVVAKPDQDDNDLTSALDLLWEGPVKVNARKTDDGLECTTDDITRLLV